MSQLEWIKSRRSTRKYQNRQITEADRDSIVEAGRYAPSGGNNQSTHVIVIQKKAVLDQLAELVKQEFAKMEVKPDTYKSMASAINASKGETYIFHYNAPTLIVTANQINYGNHMADCACALENMMLMANALELGSCWINQLRWLNENPVIEQYLKSLGLKDGERVYGAVSVGYADTESGLPNHDPLPRKGNEVTVIS